MSAGSRRYVVRFIGHVQGVGFRATCIALATGLAINGFVRNEPDGSVLLDADADPDDAQEWLSRIRSSKADNIDDVVIDEFESQGRSGGLKIAW